MDDEKELTAPAEAAETPVEAAETPAEVAEAPVEVAEASAEVAETPVEAAEAPAEVAEAPAEVAEASSEAVEVAEAPVEIAEKPEKEPKTVKDTVLTVIGILLCLLIAPILVANITMIIKSYSDPNSVPSFGGYCPFIVTTDSMKGTIDGGDLVIDQVVTDPLQIKNGDIISFFDPASRSKSIVTHRVVEVVADKDALSFRTKGDANNTADDDLVPAKNVVGIYRYKLDGFGNVVMFMQSTTGLVVCIALPILLLIGYDYVRRSRFEKKQKSETDALMKELEELRAKQSKQ